VYVTSEQLDRLTASLGWPDRLRGEFECAPSELAMVRSSQKNRRAHDLTFFLTDPAGRIATIAKHSFPPGVYRAPSGGANPGEELLDAAAREVLEELGIEAAFDRYLLRCEPVFTVEDDRVTWTSHVLVGRAVGHALSTQDPDEIREVRWSTPDELAGPIRSAMLAMERGLIGYRVALTDAVLARWALAAPRR
jgi:8-oxo-dGTP pyrophosphatase MutT (NUDIX family)